MPYISKHLALSFLVILRAFRKYPLTGFNKKTNEKKVSLLQFPPLITNFPKAQKIPPFCLDSSAKYICAL